MRGNAGAGDNLCMNIPILYENEEVLVVNKPAGLLVHPDGRTQEYTLVDWIREKYPAIAEADVGENINLTSGEILKKPGIVHRIDRETSGVLLVAKTQESFLNLKMQFQERTMKKSYKVIAHGFFQESEGIIDKPIGRSASDFRKWSAEYGARGELRDAVTEYRVLGQGLEGVTKLSYLEVFPRTGRTHQIRVHLKAKGHPILCDTHYAPKKACELGFQRMALHASSIEFRGINGVVKRVSAPLPDDFCHALAELGLV